MKYKLLLIILYSLSVKNTFGQNFAPIGAKWQYTETFFEPIIDYLLIEVIKDTTFKGKA